MLKLEYILIMSRDFYKKPKISTLKRVMRFINEEITNATKENQNEVINKFKLHQEKLFNIF